MKDKRGFTLIELMSVIVVLAIIIAIAIPVYNRIIKSINKKNYENQISLIETAGAKYAEDTRYENFFVDDLVKDGYLNADKDGNVINPINGEVMNCYIIRTKKEKDTYYATYINKKYENKPGECKTNIPNELNEKLKIVAKTADGNPIDWKKTWWVNQDVILSAELDPEYTIIDKIKWYEGNNLQEVADGSVYEIGIDSETSLQQVYKATVKVNKDGQEEEFSSTIVIAIDKIKPSFYKDDASTINKEWQTDKNYNIKAYDNQSNIYGYAMIDDRTEGCPTGKNEYRKQNHMKITKNGNYNICVIDNAGNTELREELEVDHIDNVDMECEFEIIGWKKVAENKWYIPNSTYPKLKLKLKSKQMGPSGVQLGISTKDQKSYTPDHFNNLETASVTTEIDSDKNGVKYYGFVKSQSGISASCQIELYYEHSMKAATFSTAVTSDYDKITIPYTKAEAVSGLASETCNLYNSSNNAIIKSVAASRGTCTFTGLKNANVNNNYYVKIKSVSNAGNEVWSAQSKIVTVPGYCTSGNYITTSKKVANSESACSKKCDTGTRSYKYINTYTSKYNSLSCGNSGELVGYEDCNKQTCCSKTTYKSSEWGECSDVCGGKTRRDVYSVSYYDNNVKCATASNSTNERPSEEKACGGKEVASETGCSALCSNACGQSAKTKTGTKTKYYRSTISSSKSCGSKEFTCTVSCPATEACDITEYFPEGAACECTHAYTFWIMKTGDYCTGEPYVSKEINFANYSRITGKVKMKSTSGYSGIRCIFGFSTTENLEKTREDYIIPILDVETSSEVWEEHNINYTLKSTDKKKQHLKAICYHTMDGQSTSFQVVSLKLHG